MEKLKMVLVMVQYTGNEGKSGPPSIYHKL